MLSFGICKQSLPCTKVMVKQNHAQWMCLILFSRTGISPYSYSSLLVHTWYGVFGCLAPSFLSCVNSQKYGFFIFFLFLAIPIKHFLCSLVEFGSESIYHLPSVTLTACQYQSTYVSVLKYQPEVPLYTYGVQYSTQRRGDMSRVAVLRSAQFTIHYYT